MSSELERIAVLESKVDGLVKMNETVMSNHLPHLQERLESIEKKLAYWGGGLATLIAASQILSDVLVK
jgi:hypothetical protein